MARKARSLADHPDVTAAFALAPANDGQRAIFAVVVGDIDGDDAGLTAYLAERLPGYMVPEKIRHIETMPLLPNGKLDRKALDALFEPEAPPPMVDEDLTGKEAEMIAAWGAVLNRRQISPDNSCVSLGIDSLSYVQIYLATEDLLGRMPDQWQGMTIRQLAGRETARGSIWRSIDMAMFVRAVSILVVVAAHFNITHGYPGGATSGLFLVSGLLFGQLQLSEVFMTRSSKPIWRLTLTVLIPTLLVCWAITLARLALHKNPHLSLFLLYANFAPKAENHYDFYLWYLHCTIQILALTAISYVVVARFARFHVDPLRFSAMVFTFSALLKFAALAVISPGFLPYRLPLDRISSYMVTTHWATFALGSLIACLRGPRHKAAAFFAILAYAGATAATFPDLSWLFITGSGLLLLLFKKVPMPKPFNRILLMIAGASLFIYLTHTKF